ncbi:MAG: RNA polymerase sigma factor [Prolixibacteraceae bacterium]|jgi:RNA polymerase sigma-70 factor (ECF subfamily)|nr:RNA polymerase sigma factor [Prolixibacteraceae bacterium]
MHDDQQIMEGLKSENLREKAFGALVSKYGKRLYWHIRKIVISHDDTDDALQNTFLKVWNSLDGFREESGIYTWLYRIATNEAITLLNQQKKRSLLNAGEVGDYLLEAIRTDPYFDGDEIQTRLQQAIAVLPEKQRLVFNMKYFEDMKYQDMSEILDTSVGALKASYHHAVKKIEEHFKSGE